MKQFGLLGEVLSYSFSPVIHETVFETLAVSGQYTLVEKNPKKFDKQMFLNMMSDLDGINVTIPFKQQVIPYLDRIHPAADAIGAINTVVKEGDELVGYNTDYFGALETMKMLPIDDLEGAIVLGTGGSSKAVVECLKTLGISPIYLISRSPEPDKDNHEIKCISYAVLEELNPKNCLLVNCTPVGMKTYAEALVIDEALIKRQRAVFDLIYNPTETPLLKVARENNIPGINGLNMLIIQAIEAEKLWLSVEKIEYPEIIKKVISKMK